MEGDSDNEGTNSEYEWPWAALDRGQIYLCATLRAVAK